MQHEWRLFLRAAPLARACGAASARACRLGSPWAGPSPLPLVRDAPGDNRIAAITHTRRDAVADNARLPLLAYISKSNDSQM